MSKGSELGVAVMSVIPRRGLEADKDSQSCSIQPFIHSLGILNAYWVKAQNVLSLQMMVACALPSYDEEAHMSKGRVCFQLGASAS
jgi:hypothetical protein